MEVCREQLKKALERSAEYFVLEKGGLAVSECFLKPIEQHFNYDYISGVEVTEDIRRPIGDRVVSIIAYVDRHRDITVDKTKWLNVIY